MLTERIFGRFEFPLSKLGERLWSNCQWAFRADATYLRIARELAGKEPPFDLILVYFGGPDVVGHRFWRYMQPELYQHPPAREQVENFGQIIPHYYTYIDSALGELLDAVGSEATVLVVSDHGMQPSNLSTRFDADDPPADVNSAQHEQAPAGVLIMAGPHIHPLVSRRPSARLTRGELKVLGSVYDITPTILALLRIPLGEDMDGRILTALVKDEFQLSKQPTGVPTHDTPEFLASRPTVEGHTPEEEERLRQLRSLGYIK